MKNRKINLTKLFKIGILLLGVSLLLWNCEKVEFIEENSINQSSNEFNPKIQNQFNKKDFEKIIPFGYEVDWTNPVRQYSKELETYFYEFSLNYLEERNPNSLNEKRKKGYYIKFKLIVTENQIDKKDVSFNFYIAKFYQSIDSLDNSLLNSKVSLNNNIGYKGITHLYDNRQELIFAKHITKSEKEANDEIYLDKDFRKENNLLAKGTDIPVEVCETKTIGVYQDIYRVIRDQWGNIIGYEYVTTILLYTYDKEVCYIKWIPQYVEGNGNGLFSNLCEGGQICILDVTEDLGCNSNLCNESVPDNIKEAMLIFDSANLILTPEQYLWATMNAEAVNSLAEYLRNALADNFNSVYIENIRNFYTNVFNALMSGTSINNINFDDKIINQLTGKAKCVYDKLVQLNSSFFSNLINNVFQSSKEAHIKFEIGNIPDDNNFSYKARTYPSYNGSNRFYRIRLKTEFVQNASTIEIALALIHEVIHAELLDRSIQSGLVINISPSGSYTFQNYGNLSVHNNTTIFNALTTYYKNLGNGNPQWNHDQFNIFGYRTKLIENLKQIHPWLDNQNNPLINFINSDSVIDDLDDFFSYLSWEGLEGTQEYNNVNQTKKDYISQYVRSKYNKNCN